MATAPSALVSRILLAAGLLSAAGATYWFVRTSFAPIVLELPPLPTAGVNQRFDPQADVSKRPGWGKLRPLYFGRLETGATGRDNPFRPAAEATVQEAPPAEVVPEQAADVPSFDQMPSEDGG